MKTYWKVIIALGVVIFIALLGVVSYSLLKMMREGGSILRGEVAVIPIKGPITLGECGVTYLGTIRCADVREIEKNLERADKDRLVKAILLDVSSGGGEVVASRELMRAINKTKKPVVAWIGEVGASGAYYAISATDLIMADEDSLTGSLGVVMYLEHYYKLFDWIGVNMTVIKSAPLKDIGSPYRPTTEEEKEMFQSMVDKIHEGMIRDIATNRGLSLSKVRNLSNGGLFLGREAKALGLVDRVGGFEDALNAAAKLGGIVGKPRVKRYEKRRSLVDVLSQLSTTFGYGMGRALISG